MITGLTQAAQAVPAYCTSGHGVLTPAQWKTCWDAGWSQPVTNAANAGHTAGPGVLVGALVLVAIVLLIGLTRGSSRTPAPSKS